VLVPALAVLFERVDMEGLTVNLNRDADEFGEPFWASSPHKRDDNVDAVDHVVPSIQRHLAKHLLDSELSHLLNETDLGIAVGGGFVETSIQENPPDGLFGFRRSHSCNSDGLSVAQKPLNCQFDPFGRRDGVRISGPSGARLERFLQICENQFVVGDMVSVDGPC
jgi:hypothetical protein